MAHLIQPAIIGGTKYCMICQGGCATKGVASDIFGEFGPNGASSESDGTPIVMADCGPWQLATVFAGPGLNGEISFGTSCLSSVTIELIPDSENGGTFDFEVYLDGVLESSHTIANDAPFDYEVDLALGACGQVVTVKILNQSGPDTVDLSIIAVS
jgi:hypothetical protein